jgi:hypothetical protein
LGAVLVYADFLGHVPGPPRHLTGLTGVNLGDRAVTSFWLDNWSTTGVLAAAIPALFSHCIDPTITVACAFNSVGALMLPL